MTDSKQTVQIGYGKVNLSHRSMTLAGFVVEDGFKRTLVSKRYEKIGRTGLQPVSQYPDIDGWLYTDNVAVPEGTIILIQVSSRLNGMPVADSGVFIRIRKDGAGVLIQAKLPAGGMASSHVVFSAHGDILDRDMLPGEGIELPRNYAATYLSRDERDELFNITEVTPARTAAPKLEVHISDSGEEVKLNVVTPQRRMRIKR